MQHLQARYEFQINHRAAIKSLDAPINEAETFQHIVWVYALRFLKASLALRVPGRPEAASTLQQLHAIANHAEKRGDRAIFVTACALEAMVHLRTAGADSIEHAQRAIAAARSYQLQASAKEAGQMATFVDTVDLVCSIRKGSLDRQKMAALHQRADEESGSFDGVFSVLIEKSFGGQSLTRSTGGIFQKAKDGRDELVFSWLSKNDFRMLAYYLSGVMMIPHDMSRGRSYVQEGLRITDSALQHHAKRGMSIPASIHQRSWVTILDLYMRFALGLVACRADDIREAEQALASLRKCANKAPFRDREDFRPLSSYLAGVVAQSTGELDEALKAYSTTELGQPATNPPTDLKTDLQILAVMNQLLIVRSPAHPKHHLAQALFTQLENVCSNHPNQYIVCAFRILHAIQNDDNSINRQKTLASNATNMAKSVQNYQFITLGLCLLASRFLTDTVSEQAIKSARAARALSKQARTLLWRVVAYGYCMHTFQRNGLFQDAEECRKALEELYSGLPVSLREMLRIPQHANGSEDVQMTG
jgi:tetratricopeptide (TPR) repeat protein